MTNAFPELDRIQHYTRELVQYTRDRFPQRFYGGESWSSMYAAAAILRLTDIVDSVLAHLPARRDQDAWAALRGMYELAVTLAWVLADPQTRKPLWEGEAKKQQLKLHNDLLLVGETLLDNDEIADAKAATGLPGLADRALAADLHWPARVKGLHPAGGLLSFRGLYTVIYRTGSQPTHGSIASLLPYVEQQPNRYAVRPMPPQNTPLPYALASPLLAITITVVASSAKWIDADRAREINDNATAQGPLSCSVPLGRTSDSTAVPS